MWRLYLILIIFGVIFLLMIGMVVYALRLYIMKTIKDSESRPAGFGFVKEDTPTRTRTYCLMPFNVVFRLIWIIWCWVREPFPGIKRKINLAVEALDKREETIRVISYYIKEQGKMLDSRKIGNTRFITSVRNFIIKTIKEEEPKIHNELYPPKISDESKN